jgi:hypothetical protein
VLALVSWPCVSVPLRGTLSGHLVSMSNMLSVLSWNVRGLNSPSRREVVRDVILVVRPAIVCLQEMKLSAISTQLVVEIVGHHFDRFEFLSANGTRGHPIGMAF